MSCRAIKGRKGDFPVMVVFFNFLVFFFPSDELVTILMDGSFIVGLQMLVVK